MKCPSCDANLAKYAHLEPCPVGRGMTERRKFTHRKSWWKKQVRLAFESADPPAEMLPRLIKLERAGRNLLADALDLDIYSIIQADIRDVLRAIDKAEKFYRGGKS